MFRNTVTLLHCLSMYVMNSCINNVYSKYVVGPPCIIHTGIWHVHAYVYSFILFSYLFICFFICLLCLLIFVTYVLCIHMHILFSFNLFVYGQALAYLSHTWKHLALWNHGTFFDFTATVLLCRRHFHVYKYVTAILGNKYFTRTVL